MRQLEVDHITVAHPERGRASRRQPFAVRDVSFTVDAGEIFGIVGPSGSGKTTLAAALTGLLPLRSGTIRVGGTPLHAPGTPGPARRSPVQMLFQNYSASLDPRMTVQELLREAASTAPTAPGSRELLTRVAVSESVLPLVPRQLSGGQRQRIALARALAARPSVLVADEPTSALDVITQAQVLRVITRASTEDRCAVVLISHDSDLVAALCSRIALLRNGRVRAIGSPAEVLALEEDPVEQNSWTDIPRAPESARRRRAND